MPTDTEARLGVHLSPRTGEEEYVFGRDVDGCAASATTSSVEVRLGGLALPVAPSLHPANVNEGSVFIAHDEQVSLLRLLLRKKVPAEGLIRPSA